MINNEIKVILLVAGEGKRLRPYTLDRPKCMVEVNGISLVDRQLNVLKKEGIRNIVMVGGCRSDSLNYKDIKLKLNTRYYETNMVWSLFCAEDELKGDVIVSYGDIVYSGEILKSLLQSTSDIAVVIDKNWESYWSLRNDNPLDDAETLKLRNDGTISEIGQKPKSLSEIDGQYMGLIKLSSYGVEQLKHIFHSSVKKGSLLGKKIETAYMTDLLQAIIQSGERVTAVPTYSEWVEVDTVKDLKLEVTTERLDKIHHE